MGRGSSGKGGKKGKKRVHFRPNRSKPSRQKQWSVPDENAPEVEDAVMWENVRAKGDLSRKRTVVESNESQEDMRSGTVVAVRGQFVEVDDGERVWPCSVRRVLRTRRIGQRNPVTVGDRVSFSVVADSEGVVSEGVIEQVHERRTMLQRSDGRRTQMIAANVDQVVLITSIREPRIKPHLIDRYLVAAHAGHLPAVICVNKVDLDVDGEVAEFLQCYDRLGYQALGSSVVTGRGVDELKSLLTDKVSLLAGQSGVGKSSLLNVIQPSLNLKVGSVSETTEKGRHTTTTAVWHKLEFGGAVIDTPGIRALDVAMVPLHELEMHFVEFVERVADCKFPNCVHIHEEGCAIKEAVEAGEINPRRYESYVQLFYERSEAGG